MVVIKEAVNYNDRDNMMYQFRIILGFLIGSAISSCGVFQNIDDALPNHRADYGKSKITAPLEIPPDLIAGDMTEELAIPDVAGTMHATSHKALDSPENVLPAVTQVQMKREGDTRWLEVAYEVNDVWQKVRTFWQAEGFSLSQEDPETGVMETEWKENRADIPEGGIRKLVGGVLGSVYSASTRDKFRTRLERGQETGTTAVYLTHRGVEEVNRGNSFVWQARPTDPELEAEMLRRLLIFLGLEEKQADTVLTAETKPVIRAVLQRGTDDQSFLLVKEDVEHAWQRTGLALDRLGFTIIDRDQTRGIYRFFYLDSEQDGGQGFWAGLFGGDEKPAQQEYVVSLFEAQKYTQVSVKNKSDQIDKVAEHILTLLEEQLK